MFCKNCGNEIEDNVNFCDRCGFSTASNKVNESKHVDKNKSNFSTGVFLMLVLPITILIAFIVIVVISCIALG